MKQLFKIRGFLPYIIMLFINAFVDLGHKIVIQNTVFKIYDGQTQVILTAVVNGLILLPFILLFSPAGFLSDKYPKQLVMRYSAWAAVIAVLLITLSYYQGWFWCAYALTLALGIQAAIYSPAKYGFIRELVGDQHLGQGNGIVQAVTIVAILGGTFVFSALFETLLSGVTLDNTSTIVSVIAPIGWVLVGFTLIEVWLAYRLPAKRDVDISKHFSAAAYFQGAYLKHNLKAITSKRGIWLSIIGLSMFWSISQVVLASFPAYAKAVLSETNTLVIQGILACTGFGIIAGSLVAGRISKNYIELGLIPAGALGFAFALGFMPTLETRAGMASTFMALGFLGGLFIIPLNALIQYHANEDELGTVLAGNNWIQNIAMLGFLSLTIVFAALGITSTQLFYILMVVAFAGALYTVYELPHSLTRIIAAAFITRKYKISVVGFDKLPKSGAVLLFGNASSWIDWAMVQIACPRPVRFVMLRSIYNRWYLKPFFQLLGVIPVSAEQSHESSTLINEQLKAGEVVCLFHSDYEPAVEGVDGVIVPFYVHAVHAATVVTFGKVLLMDIKVEQLRQKIFELSVDTG